jgi:hypothetical protein
MTGYVEKWECPEPPPGTKYRVVRSRWDAKANPPVRTIYEWIEEPPDRPLANGESLELRGGYVTDF